MLCTVSLKLSFHGISGELNCRWLSILLPVVLRNQGRHRTSGRLASNLLTSKLITSHLSNYGCTLSSSVSLSIVMRCFFEEDSWCTGSFFKLGLQTMLSFVGCEQMGESFDGVDIDGGSLPECGRGIFEFRLQRQSNRVC